MYRKNQNVFCPYKQYATYILGIPSNTSIYNCTHPERALEILRARLDFLFHGVPSNLLGPQAVKLKPASTKYSTNVVSFIKIF